jgi:hypothetical protein
MPDILPSPKVFNKRTGIENVKEKKENKQNA